MLETISLPCDCCGAQDERLIMSKAGELTKQSFRVVQCRNCGFLYINPSPTEAAIVSLYDSAYYDGAGFDSDVAYTCRALDGDEKRQLARQCLRFIPPPAKILDYGCGVGGFMRAAIELGYQVEGYEPSSDGRVMATETATVYSIPAEIPSQA